MENYQYSNSSYPDSVNSSPRSREVDLENSSWDEPLASSNSYKVKFMCSYGGNIRPRPHDNQLTYMGGDTKILAVDRNTKFSTFNSKLSSMTDSSEVCFKYQLPGEDLDALISVTNDEDLEHMMLEYDRLNRSLSMPARLRLFIFPVNGNPPSVSSFGSNDSKSERQWFVDALNAAHINQNLEGSSQPPAAAAGVVVEEPTRNPDFLFGLEKGGHHATPKVQEPPPVVPQPVLVEPVVPQADLQRQIHELQMQISSHEQDLYGRKMEDYYQQKPPPQPTQPQQAVPVTTTGAYWQERHMPTYPAGVGIGVGGTEAPPMYLVQTPAGVYQTPGIRQVSGQINQPYYGMQRIMTEGYREQPVYNQMVPPVSSSLLQQPKPGGAAYTSEGIGLVRPCFGASEPGYAQVSFDNTGRQVYYAAPGGVNVMQPPPSAYQGMPTVAAPVDVRQTATALNPDGKIIVKTSQTP